VLLLYMSKWACQANSARARSDPTRIVSGLARHANNNGSGRAGLAHGPDLEPKHGTGTL
jgi:hypothetical protein